LDRLRRLRAGSLTGLNRFLILTPAPHGPESLPDFQNTTFMTAQFLETKQGSYFILDTYAPSSEVVRSGLRLLVKHESAHLKLQDLLQAAEEDFRAGRVQSFVNTNEIYAEIRRHVETRRTNK
jgi:Arc/MetJ-type ribon-helix-helix transcriptional regulator